MNLHSYREDFRDPEDTLRLSTMHPITKHHFKFEHGGMLVYDCKAVLICGHYTEPGSKPPQEPRKKLPSATLKELESADERGNP